MYEAIRYAAATLVCSSVLMVVYRWLFADKLPFGICRAYLMIAVTLSLVIPALRLPLLPPNKPVEQTAAGRGEQRLEFKTVTIDYERVMPTEEQVTRRNGTTALVASIYAALAAAIGILTTQGVRDLRDLKYRSRITRCKGYDIAVSESIETPYSFMGTIYLSPDTPDEERDPIIAHERSHIAHRHSWERLYMGVLRTAVWFNPFIWLADRWLIEVQEFEADRDVLDAGYDLTLYRSLIFRQIFGYSPDIQSGFYSLTRRRFEMMTRRPEMRRATFRIAAAAAVAIGLTAIFGVTRRTVPETDEQFAAAVETTSNVVSVGRINGRSGIFYLPRNPRRRYRLEGERIYVSTVLGGEREITSNDFRQIPHPQYYIDGRRVSAATFASRPDFLTAAMNIYTGAEAAARFGRQARGGVWAVTTLPESRYPALMIDGRRVDLKRNLPRLAKAVRIEVLDAAAAMEKYGAGYPNGVVEAWDIIE